MINKVKAILLQDDEFEFYYLYCFINNKWQFDDVLSKDVIGKQIKALQLQPIYDAMYNETKMKAAVGEELHDLFKHDNGLDDTSIFTVYEILIVACGCRAFAKNEINNKNET